MGGAGRGETPTGGRRSRGPRTHRACGRVSFPASPCPRPSHVGPCSENKTKKRSHPRRAQGTGCDVRPPGPSSGCASRRLCGPGRVAQRPCASASRGSLHLPDGAGGGANEPHGKARSTAPPAAGSGAAAAAAAVTGVAVVWTARGSSGRWRLPMNDSSLVLTDSQDLRERPPRRCRHGCTPPPHLCPDLLLHPLITGIIIVHHGARLPRFRAGSGAGGVGAHPGSHRQCQWGSGSVRLARVP